MCGVSSAVVFSYVPRSFTPAQNYRKITVACENPHQMGLFASRLLTEVVAKRTIQELLRNSVATLDSGGLWGTPYDFSDRR